MARTVQRPLVGQLARYEGIFQPHWEITHITVRVSRNRKIFIMVAVAGLGVLGGFWIGIFDPLVAALLGGFLFMRVATPAEEWWKPAFPPGFIGNLEDCFDDPGGPIEFEGIITAPGRYGHKGIMRREVEIVRIIKYQPRRAL